MRERFHTTNGEIFPSSASFFDEIVSWTCLYGVTDMLKKGTYLSSDMYRI